MPNIKEFKNLMKGNSNKINKNTLKQSFKYFKELSNELEHELVVPNVEYDQDGNTLLSWSDRDRYLELEVRTEGTIQFYFMSDGPCDSDVIDREQIEFITDALFDESKHLILNCLKQF